MASNQATSYSPGNGVVSGHVAYYGTGCRTFNATGGGCITHAYDRTDYQ